MAGVTTALVLVGLTVAGGELGAGRAPTDLTAGSSDPEPRVTDYPNTVEGWSMPPVDYRLEAIQEVLEPWNARGYSMQGLVRGYVNAFGEPRCWAGFMAEFPDHVMITMIWPSGYWLQFSPSVDVTSGYTMVRNGPDYIAAGFSEESFDSSGYFCYTDGEGKVYV